jgi:hypothetical protein
VMLTTQEQRTALEAKGWRLMANCDRIEHWNGPTGAGLAIYDNGRVECDGDLRSLVDAAAIIGITKEVSP